MNHIIFSKTLLSSISLVILFGMTNAVLAMEEKPTGIKRFRGAKAKHINYAEDSESPRDSKRNREKSQSNNSQVKPVKKKLFSDHYKSELQKPIANTRGVYLGTNTPRINLRPDSVTADSYDYYLYLDYNVSRRNRILAFFESQNSK